MQQVLSLLLSSVCKRPEFLFFPGHDCLAVLVLGERLCNRSDLFLTDDFRLAHSHLLESSLVCFSSCHICPLLATASPGWLSARTA
jgi:hypothetical protein